MFKKIFIVFLLTIFSTLLFPNLVSAQTQNPKEIKLNKRKLEDVSKALKNLEKIDPQKPISQKLNRNLRDSNELVSDQKDLQIKFDLKNKKVKLANKNRGDLTLLVPNISQIDSADIVDNKIVYSGKDSKADVIVESLDGGIRQIINIKDASAPSFYDFPVELASGDKIVINSDGSAMVTKDRTQEEINSIPKDVPKEVVIPNYSVKISIAKPWAKDANAKDLKTWYSVENGNILRQNIELKGAAFPVVADPIWCGTAFNSVSWIRRDGVWSASNSPTWCGAWECYMNHWSCWQESYNRTPSYWHIGYNVYYVWNKNTNYWSMYNQFICHANIAKGYKNIWNLEPSTSDKGYYGFVLKACN